MVWCGPLVSEERERDRENLISVDCHCVMFLYLHLQRGERRRGREEKWLLVLPLSLSVITPHFTRSLTERHLSPKPISQFPQNHQNLTSLAPGSLTPPLSPHSLPVLSKAQSLPRYISRILHLIDCLLQFGSILVPGISFFVRPILFWNL